MSRLSGMLSIALCAGAQDLPTPLELLQRVADSVSLVQSYDLEILTYKDQNSDGGIPSKVLRSLTRSFDRFRDEWSYNGERMSLNVGDGKMVWRYMPLWNQYIEEPLPSPGADEAAKAFELAERRYLGRFRLLPKLSVKVTRAGTGVVKTRTGRYSCSILKLSPVPAEQPWWEERLWVDEAAGVVRRSAMSRHETRGGRSQSVTEIVIWKRINLNAHPDERLFRFVPPRNARRVEEFRAPRGPFYR